MSDKSRILVVDDDEQICDLLVRYLALEGFEVESALDGKAMRKKLTSSEFDLALIDLNLPDVSGFDLVKELYDSSEIGIIMLTGSDQKVDKIIGLEQGADDYVQKPFDERELLARIRSVLRRRRVLQSPGGGSKSVRQVGKWTIDLSTREVHRNDGTQLALTSREFELLSLFVRHANEVLSRDQISDVLSARDWNPTDRSIDVMVSKLRKKIEENVDQPRFIKTIRGAGYVMAVDPVER